MTRQSALILAAGVTAAALLGVVVAAPAHAQNLSETRTYTYIDGQSGQPIADVPSWATRMVIELTGGAGGGVSATDKTCKVSGGAGTRVTADIDLDSQGRTFSLYLGQQGSKATFRAVLGGLDQKSWITKGDGGQGWKEVDNGSSEQIVPADGGSSTYGGGGGGASLLTGPDGAVALAGGGGGAGTCGVDHTSMSNWFWNPGGAGGSDGAGKKGTESERSRGGAGTGGAMGGESGPNGGSMTSGTVAGGGAGGGGARGGRAGAVTKLVDSTLNSWAGYGGGGSGSSSATVPATFGSGPVGNGSAVVTFYQH